MICWVYSSDYCWCAFLLQELSKAGITTKKAVTQQEASVEDVVASYEEAFAMFKEATGIEDIDKLVQRFIEVEDQNFSLFNFVNELNNEIEILQEKVNLPRFRSACD